FIAALERGEQPGLKRHYCTECGKEIVGGHRLTCSDGCHLAKKRRIQRDSKRRAWERDPEGERAKQRERRQRNPDVYRQMERERRIRNGRTHRRFCQQCGIEITGTTQRK